MFRYLLTKFNRRKVLLWRSDQHEYETHTFNGDWKAMRDCELFWALSATFGDRCAKPVRSSWLAMSDMVD